VNGAGHIAVNGAGHIAVNGAGHRCACMPNGSAQMLYTARRASTNLKQTGIAVLALRSSPRKS
jgi:hypothetical protein